MDNSVLYRYSEEQYIREFLETGHMRLAQLSYSQDIEALGTAIGDDQEGYTEGTYVQRGDYYHTGIVTPETPAPLREQAARGNLDNGAHILFRNDVWVDTRVANPAFIQSTSRVLSRRMLTDFGNTVIRIDDPLAYTQAIALGLHLQAGRIASNMGWGPCQYYSSRTFEWESRHVHPGFVKTDAYAYQEEVRFYWQVEDPSKPVFITVPDAARVCTLIEPADIPEV